MENIKIMKKSYISKISNLIKKNKYKQVFKNILYYPVKVLGEGTGGEVVKVQNSQGETAALKIIEFGGSVLEYDIGLLAGNASIGPIHYSYTKLKNNYSYILMEEIKGATLDEINVTTDILHNILDVYYSLYIKYGIIHNDLKSQNIIYTNDNKIKIIDYGEAEIYKPDATPIFDIENHMIKMSSLLINSLTFEYNKYNKGKENIYFNRTNTKENNTYYFIRLYTSSISWLTHTFNKPFDLDINYDISYIDINIIQNTNIKISFHRSASTDCIGRPFGSIDINQPRKNPVLYRRLPSISNEHLFFKKNILRRNLFE
jgi:serine/threonine protein kinase